MRLIIVQAKLGQDAVLVELDEGDGSAPHLFELQFEKDGETGVIARINTRQPEKWEDTHTIARSYY